MNPLPPHKVNVLVVEDSQGVRAFQLDRILYKVGRSETADIQILGKEVSRNHATLLRIPAEQGGFVYRLVDGDSRTKKRSSNGTYVNGVRITTYQLQNNDQIVFAKGVAAKLFYVIPETANRLLSAPLPIMQDIDPALRLDATTYANLPESSPTEDAPNPFTFVAKKESVLPETSPFNPKISVSANPKSVISSAGQNKSKPVKTSKKLQHSRLGQFFLRTSALDEQKLEELLREQAGSQKRLGELLVEKGMISQDELDKALENQQILLGDILVKHNYISADQLTQALKTQKETFQPLGEILIHEGWITIQEMEQALREQHWRRNGFWFLD